MLIFTLIIIATLLIGLLIYYYNKVEKFTAEPVNIQDAVDGLGTLLSAVGSGNIPEGHPYVETLANIPSSSNLKLYLTSFSERTNYDNGVKTYIPESSRWSNFIKSNQSFFVKGSQDNITAVIRPGGMLLNKVTLEGMRSDELNTVDTDYTLKSFSATFFIKFTPPQTGSNYVIPDNCELFTISLETPNYMRLMLIEGSDDLKCKLELQIGESSSKLTTAEIDKSALMSVNPTSITITCNISSDNIKTIPTIYIGNSDGTTYSPIISGTDTPPTFTHDKLILGNSRISINTKNTELDARLLAFMFFSSVLTETEHKLLTSYLVSQNSLTPSILSTLNTSATAQLENIRQLIANNTATQGTLQEQLNKCKASIPPVVKAFGHAIKMDGVSSVSTEDLRSCSVLEIKNRLTAAVAATTASTETSGTAASRYQISMPTIAP